MIFEKEHVVNCRVCKREVSNTARKCICKAKYPCIKRYRQILLLKAIGLTIMAVLLYSIFTGLKEALPKLLASLQAILP